MARAPAQCNCEVQGQANQGRGWYSNRGRNNNQNHNDGNNYNQNNDDTQQGTWEACFIDDIGTDQQNQEAEFHHCEEPVEEEDPHVEQHSDCAFCEEETHDHWNQNAGDACLHNENKRKTEENAQKMHAIHVMNLDKIQN